MICCRCKQDLPEVSFYKNKTRRSGRQGYCIECQSQYQRNSPYEKTKQYAVKHRFGLDKDAFDTLVETSSSQCSICSKVLTFNASKQKDRAFIDHCHDTGDVRGILCLSCNTGIGMFNDNPELIASAIEYLNNPPFKHGKEE